jgi:putative endonuclease
VTRLVHLERFGNVEAAIRREKQLKGWNREWKLELIREQNPPWDDLYEEACRTHGPR